MTTLTSKNKRFSDLNFMFSSHPMTGDVTRKYDEDSVKQALISLIKTKPYESPFHPEISCQANNLLFELASPITAELIKTSIIQVISKFEPRINKFKVTVSDNIDANSYVITIEYNIIGNDRVSSVTTLLNRSR